MNEDHMFDICELKCVIKIVNIFLTYICQFMSPEKQTSRQIRSARVLLGIRLVKDKRERTGDVGL